MTYQTGNSKRAYLAFFFLLGIPALLMLVFALTFSKTLPDVPPAGTFSPMLFAAPFLHLDSAHLISNLVVYLSLVTLLLLIEDWLSRLVLSFAFIVLMLPVIESFIVGLLIPFPLITIGFSGIITALAGILLIVFAFRTDRVFPRLFIYGIFLLNVALSPILYHNYPIILLLLIPAFILIIPTCLRIAHTVLRTGISSYLATLFFPLAPIRKQNNILFTILSVFLVLLLVYCLIPLSFSLPADFVRNGVFINILSHFLGYITGIGIALVTTAILLRRSNRFDKYTDL